METIILLLKLEIMLEAILSLFKVFFILLGCTILSFEISVNSTLADAIKRFFNLSLDKQSNIDVFKLPLFWQSLMGRKWMVVFKPFIWIITKFFTIWKWVNELFNCPFCIGYHISWIALWIIFGYPFFHSLGIALFSILIAKIYDKIN